MRTKISLFFILGLIFGLVLFVSCSNDPAGPINEENGNNDTLPFSGITETDLQGNIEGGDMTDWCYSSTKFNAPIPDNFAFYPAYPNPNGGKVTLRYDLPVATDVLVKIVDSDYNVIKILVDENQEAGEYSIKWDHTADSGDTAAAGIYRAFIEADGFSCYGDIMSQPPEMILYTEYIDSQNIKISYEANQPVAALFMLLPYTQSVKAVNFAIATNNMAAYYNPVTNPLRIFVSTPPDELRYMPAGKHDLCWVYFEGEISLDSAQASDTLGLLLFDIDIVEDSLLQE